MSGDKVRAVRNSNPCNIRVGDPWQGLMPEAEMNADQKAEKEFCVFAAPKWGFRAAAHILVAYFDRYGINTIAGIVARWAPASENDTKAYIRHVCDLTEMAADRALELHAYSDVAPIVKAMATHEAGGWFFNDLDLTAGLTLAGLQPPAQSLAQSRTVKAATIAGGSAAAVTSIAETAAQLQPALGIVKAVHDYAPTMAAVILGAALLVIVYYRIDDWRRAVR